MPLPRPGSVVTVGIDDLQFRPALVVIAIGDRNELRLFLSHRDEAHLVALTMGEAGVEHAIVNAAELVLFDVKPGAGVGEWFPTTDP